MTIEGEYIELSCKIFPDEMELLSSFWVFKNNKIDMNDVSTDLYYKSIIKHLNLTV